MSTVEWTHDFNEALKQAQAEDKLVLLDFCAPT